MERCGTRNKYPNLCLRLERQLYINARDLLSKSIRVQFSY